ncbi:ectoine/hydroxyectoine ABC transporter substrate-binding protein EhuB [Mesorhizobium sp. M0674]|uniref:ectoine/hydroxyectoine ABC transporter substrate-binding protein EhuB n=1 Tax=unclassified Mesorhizobium TaxID=325217 RepID=UPI00333C64AB
MLPINKPRGLSRLSRMLLAILMGAASPCLAVAQSLDKAKSDGVTVAIANEPPYAFMGADGSPTGAGPELDKAILATAGITWFSGQVMEYGAMIPAVQSKRVTFASAGSLTITPERCQAVIYSEPLICDGFAYLVPSALADKVHNYKDIASAGLTIGTCGGCTSQKAAIAAGIPEGKIVIIPDAMSGLKLLQDGRIDVFAHSILGIADMYDTRHLVDQDKFKFVRDDTAPPSCQGAAFRKEDGDLRDAYNEGIKKVRASGEYIKILKKFNFEAASFGVDNATTKQICAGK